MFVFLIGLSLLGLALMLISKAIVAPAAFRHSSRAGLLCLFVPGYSMILVLRKGLKQNEAASVSLYFSGLILLLVGIVSIIVAFSVAW